MKITNVIALFVLTISFSFGLVGCKLNENISERVNKASISNEETSNDNLMIENQDQNQNVNQEADKKPEENNGLEQNVDPYENKGPEEKLDLEDNKGLEDNKDYEDIKEPGENADHEDSENQSEYNEYLLKENEEIIISFSIVGSDKAVALCKSKEEPDYIVYRFGTSKHVEFEYPDNPAESWDKFTYSYYLRGGSTENEGLDLNYVTFEYRGSSYAIFQEYASEADATDVGIRITDLTSFEETILKASEDSIIGDLRELRDSDKIQIDVQ